MVLGSDPASGAEVPFTAAHAGSTVCAGEPAFGSVVLDGSTSNRLVTGLIGDVYTITADPPPGWTVTAAGCTGIANPGETGGICVYDLLVVYSDGEEAEWYEFDLCELRRIALFYDRYEGTTWAEYE